MTKMTPEEIKATVGPDWKGRITISWSDEETRIECWKPLGLDEWERVHTATKEGFIFGMVYVLDTHNLNAYTQRRKEAEAIIAGTQKNAPGE